MIEAIAATPLFGLTLTLLAYMLGKWIQKKTGSLLANPLLIASAVCIAVMVGFQIPYESYARGGDLIKMMVAPATAALALGIYRQYGILKQYFFPVVLGCLAGSLTSIGSVIGLCALFQLDEVMTASLVAKSCTSAIAIGVAESRGGLIAISALSTLLTGLVGAIGAPAFAKWLRVNHPVAQGVAIGASSHALGTTKAQEMGELQGALSGTAIGVSGLISVIIFAFV